MSWCLVTDLDGTLLGESSSTLALRDAIRTARARSGAAPPRWVIATGRGAEDTRSELLEAGFSLAEFDALITSVGAEIRIGTGAAPDPDYHAYLNGSGFDPDIVRRSLDVLRGLQRQPPHEQFRHKVSYFVDDMADAMERVASALAKLPFPTRSVFSHDNYLDVAPANGTKGGAVEFLRQRWNLSPELVVAAGDSGNDLSMLAAPWHGIVVGNGAEQLAELRGRERVFFAAEKYAAGVLEGLRVLGLLE